jgi:hypothetical protein
MPAIEERPRGGPIQCSEHLQQSRFAASARTRHGNKFTFFDREIDSPQGLDLSVIELSGQYLCFEQGHSASVLTTTVSEPGTNSVKAPSIV